MCAFGPVRWIGDHAGRPTWVCGAPHLGMRGAPLAGERGGHASKKSARGVVSWNPTAHRSRAPATLLPDEHALAAMASSSPRRPARATCGGPTNGNRAGDEGTRRVLRGCSIRAGLKAHVCLPGSASPPACRGPASPPACRGSASPPACRGRSSNGGDRRPLALRLPDRPLCAAEPARRAHSCQRGTSCRSENNPPLTHGDPAEAGPPGQSQPSRVHPVKQQAGAMRTRTGARPSSSSCASPVAWI